MSQPVLCHRLYNILGIRGKIYTHSKQDGKRNLKLTGSSCAKFNYQSPRRFWATLWKSQCTDNRPYHVHANAKADVTLTCCRVSRLRTPSRPSAMAVAFLARPWEQSNQFGNFFCTICPPHMIDAILQRSDFSPSLFLTLVIYWDFRKFITLSVGQTCARISTTLSLEFTSLPN